MRATFKKRRLVWHVDHSFNGKTSRADAVAGARASFALWQTAGVFEFVESPVINADLDILINCGPVPEPGTSNVAAVARFYAGTPETEFATITFDHTERFVRDLAWWQFWRAGHDLDTILLHEIGHCLGFAHSHRRREIMFVHGVGAKFRQITTNEIAELQRFYGALDHEPPTVIVI